MEMPSTEAKVVILGGQGVGKTSIVMCYLGNNFSKHVSPTIGASFFSCKVNVSGKHVKLQIWDTAGQERFRAMAPMYYRNADAALLVFDVTSWDSFSTMKSWVSELRKNVDEVVTMCVLGNKNDLSASRKVTTEVAQAYANSIGAIYFETSALQNEGIEDAFLNTTMLILESMEKRPPTATIAPHEEESSISLHKRKEMRGYPEDDERSWLCC